MTKTRKWTMKGRIKSQKEVWNKTEEERGGWKMKIGSERRWGVGNKRRGEGNEMVVKKTEEWRRGKMKIWKMVGWAGKILEDMDGQSKGREERRSGEERKWRDSWHTCSDLEKEHFYLSFLPHVPSPPLQHRFYSLNTRTDTHTGTYCTLSKMSVNHGECSVFSVFILSPLTESTVCVCSNSRSGGRH